ncbi:MAG: hypothetical protein ACJAYU_003900 [Bradymonadia bacterium]|jgi:hypothetical protein
MTDAGPTDTDTAEITVDVEAEVPQDAASDITIDLADAREDVREPLPAMPTTRPGWSAEFCADYPAASLNNGRNT